MASINKVILIGHLGRDPEVKYTKDDTAICNFNIATAHRWKDNQGNTQGETEWHRIVAFGRQGEVVQKYLHRGDPVYIEGRLKTTKYTDKKGVDRYQTQIICEVMQLLATRSKDEQTNQRQATTSDDDPPF